jgi:hypothetical protein
MSRTVQIIFLLTVFSGGCAAQSAQQIQRFNYHLWGTVQDENSHAMSNITVCFLPSERPISGRIPCTKTSDRGTFSLTVNDIPDKYSVCASTTETPFKRIGDKDPNHRIVCSKTLTLGPQDTSRKINLKFEPKKQAFVILDETPNKSGMKDEVKHKDLLSRRTD